MPRSAYLPPDPELLDQSAIAPHVVPAQVVEQPSPLPDQEEEATAGVMILLIHLEVLGELLDPLREDGDLDLRRTCVSLVELVLADDLRLLLCLDCQTDR